MNWISSVYECRLCTTLTCSDLNTPCIILYSWQTACCWWSVRSCCDNQEVRCCASLDLRRLCYDCQRCTLAVAQHCHASAQERLVFGKYLNAHFKFTVYGHNQARSYSHTSAQSNPASVGLTQARPNHSLSFAANNAWFLECEKMSSTSLQVMRLTHSTRRNLMKLCN